VTKSGGEPARIVMLNGATTTQWLSFVMVVTGKIRYPGRNDVPTPAGYERVVMRSLREVESFEKQAKVPVRPCIMTPVLALLDLMTTGATNG